MTEPMEIQITLEDFKLIKSFYPDFTRKQIASNDFVIGWSELMPVVENINSLNHDVQIYPTRARFYKNNIDFIESIHPGYSLIEVVYCGVVEFIKWFNSNHPTAMTEPMKTEDQELLDLSNKYREEQYPQIAIGKDLATAVTAALHCQAGFIAGYKAGKISGVVAERERIKEKLRKDWEPIMEGSAYFEKKLGQLIDSL